MKRGMEKTGGRTLPEMLLILVAGALLAFVLVGMTIKMLFELHP